MAACDRLLLATAAMVLTTPTFAAEETPGTARASVYAGVTLANTDSQRVDAGAFVQFRDAWSASAAVARADVELPDTNTRSTLAAAKLSYDFGAFGLGAGFRYGEIDAVSESRGLLATAFLEHRELRFGLEIERRETTLEPSTFTEDLGSGLGLVSGIARCSVDGLGVQGRVDLERPAWSAFAALRGFDYDAYDCALEITSAGAAPGNGPPPQARGRALGRRLAAPSLNQSLGAASRLAPREAALLKSTASLGFTMPVTARWIGGVELYRDVEELAGDDYLTGVVFASTRLDDTWSVELSLGYSAADRIGDSAFAGARVSATL
jgi:hypothetical protein